MEQLEAQEKNKLLQKYQELFKEFINTTNSLIVAFYDSSRMSWDLRDNLLLELEFIPEVGAEVFWEAARLAGYHRQFLQSKDNIERVHILYRDAEVLRFPALHTRPASKTVPEPK